MLVGAASLAVAVVIGAQPAATVAQSGGGASVFSARCASCHQPGGVGLPPTFPPLPGNPNAVDPAYVRSVIEDGRTGSIEVDGVTYNGVMPAVVGLSEGEVDQVVAYVVELAGASPSVTTPATAADPAAAAPDPARGRRLFVGSDRLSAGGPPCAACHRAGDDNAVGAGGLGPDLTGAPTRLGGEAGLAAWLTAPPSPTMQPLFAGRDMTGDEIADLVAYLGAAQVAPTSGRPLAVPAAAATTTVALLGAMAMTWRGTRRTYRTRLRSRT